MYNYKYNNRLYIAFGVGFLENNNLPSNTDNKFLVDWLSFTSKIDSDYSIFEVLGLSHVKNYFQHIYGFQGYRQRLYFDGISIHYDHSKNEGVWVEMSGQGCRTFETYSKITFFDLFNICIYNQDNGDYHVTRLDVAYDDFNHIIPLRKLSKQVLKLQFVSKFNPKSCTVTQSAGYQGITVDLGSRKSALKYRIYDKAFERGYFQEIDNGFSWVRWECQLRDDRALNFMRECLSCTVGTVFKSVLFNYFRVVDVSESDSNKRRWNTSKWFSKFIGEVEKISLFTPCKTDYNLYKCERYVYSQAGNAVYTLIKIKGVDKFVSELQESKSETSPKYIELLNSYLAESENHSNNIVQFLAERGVENA